MDKLIAACIIIFIVGCIATVVLASRLVLATWRLTKREVHKHGA